MSNRRTEPRKVYARAWLDVFAALDREHESPTPFLAAVGWNPMDLSRMTSCKRISDDKIIALDSFCSAQRIPVPLEPTHPAMVRLYELRARSVEHATRRIGLPRKEP